MYPARCPNPPCGRAFTSDRSGAVNCPACGTVTLIVLDVDATVDPTPAAPPRHADRPADTLTERANVASTVDSPAAGDSEAFAAAPMPATIERFTVRAKLGAGAFGDVYRAHDPQLDREVALKVAKPGTLDSPERVGRFLREARAAANLRHPHIVPVFDSGRDGDRHYIASGFIDGRTLEAEIDAAGGAPLDLKRAARVVKKLAEALGYAHGQGVVHRDVKPANVLVDKGGEPSLTDFGLAVRAGDEAVKTQDGKVMGTPAYMSPEQAAGKSAGATAACDQYALGVILYEMATGRRPFEGGVELVLVQQIRVEPRRPRAENRAVPKDLETVVLKCLEKEPAKRYPTCEALAEDLRRFLDGEPVVARRIGPVERLARWARRNPAVAGSVLFGVLALVVGAGVAVGQAGVARQEARRATAAAGSEAAQKQVAEDAAAELGVALDEQTAQLYDNYIAVAERELTLGHDVGLAGSLLEKCPPRLRGWEWDYLMRLRDGGRLALGDSPALGPRPVIKGAPGGHRAGLWRTAFSPDGRRLATCSIDGTVKLWDPATDTLLRTIRNAAVALPGLPPVPLLCLAFSPDGRQIAAGSFNLRGLPGVVKIWDAETGREVLAFGQQVGPVLSIAYSPDGRHVASSTVNADNSFVVWDARTKAVVKVVRGHTSNVYRLRYSPDGRHLLAGAADGTARLWDAAALTEVWTVHAHDGPVQDVAFAPDGRRFATASLDGTVKVWDTATGAPALAPLRGHSGSALGVAFSPDGTRIASAGYDKTVRLWDAADGKLKITLRGHTDWVTSVAFSPSGRQLASAAFDSTARIWDATPRQAEATPGLFSAAGHTDRVNSVAFSRDGRLIASGGWDQTVRLWDAQTGAPRRTLGGHTGSLWCVAFSPDGSRLASASWDGTVKVWDTGTGQALLTFREHVGQVQGVAFSPDGARVASVGMDATLRIWDPATGKVAARGVYFSPLASVTFSPDGERVATGSTDRTVLVWDAGRATRQLTLTGHGGAVPSLSFTPDGRRLVTASWDYTLKVWDVDPAHGESWDKSRDLMTLRGHADQVNGVAVSRDGRRIASAGEDKTVRVWDAGTGAELPPPCLHRGPVWAVAFSPGGARLVTGCWARSGRVRTWDARR